MGEEFGGRHYDWNNTIDIHQFMSKSSSIRFSLQVSIKGIEIPGCWNVTMGSQKVFFV